MHSLSRTTSSRKGAVMVLDTAIPKNRKSTKWPGMRGRDAARKLTLKVDILQVHDRFLRDPVHRESQLAIGWSQQKCKEWDELAKEDQTYKLTPEERRRYQGQWYLTLIKAGKNGPMKLRSDYRAAVMMINHLHHESREPVEEPIHPCQQRRIRQGQEVFSEDYFSSARVDQHTGWQYWLSSTKSSWYASEWSWKWAHNFFARISFDYSWFRLQLIAIHCNRRTPSHRCCSACLIKTCSSTCHHVSDRALSLFALTSSSLECLYTFSDFFISSILVIILHVVGTAEY